MRKVRLRHKKPLAIYRVFARSRHENGFAAAAYELVVPIRERERMLPAGDKQIDRGSLTQEQLVRRRA
jgi:hypothetical protein